MRHAHTLFSVFLAAGAAAADPCFAQVHAVAPLASDPTAGASPLQHRAMPSSGSVEATYTDWRSANGAVGEFPRGHADILHWEAGQGHAESALPGAEPVPLRVHEHSPSMHPGGKP